MLSNCAGFLKLRRLPYEEWCSVSCRNPNTSRGQGREPWILQRALDQPSPVARFRAVCVTPSCVPHGGVLQDPVTSEELTPGEVGEMVLGSKGRKRRRDATPPH